MLETHPPAKPPAPNIIGTYEAKTHWSEITDRVAAGESFTITKHGKPIASLHPIEDQAQRRNNNLKFREHILEIRKGQTLGGITLRELRDEGRRY